MGKCMTLTLISPSTRKDVERGFGVYEKKFHCVTHPIRLFYMDDIRYLVGGTIVLHNMMVKERIQQGEKESSCNYNLVSDFDPNNRTTAVSENAVLETAAAKEAVNKQEAEIAAASAASASAKKNAKSNNAASDKMDREKEIRYIKHLTRSMKFVHYYWKELTDFDEHMRLQNAIKKQLYKDNFGNLDNADEVANFDPFEDYMQL